MYCGYAFHFVFLGGQTEIIIVELILCLGSASSTQGGGEEVGRTGRGDPCWSRSKAKGGPCTIASAYFCVCLRRAKLKRKNKSGFYLVLVKGKGHGTTFPEDRRPVHPLT